MFYNNYWKATKSINNFPMTLHINLSFHTCCDWSTEITVFMDEPYVMHLKFISTILFNRRLLALSEQYTCNKTH